MESRKYDVFVSYSRKDAEIVDRICQLMRQKQIAYYRDTQEMPGGETFFNELANAILDSVVFLYIGSKNSYSSIYTPKEINFAISKNTNIIIPYLIDDSPLPNNLFLAFSDLNIRNQKEHSPEVILEDIVKAVPRLKNIVKSKAPEEKIEGINFYPYYKDALEYYNIAERLYYDDRFESLPQMRMAALAYSKYAEMLGYTNRGKWLYNEIWTGDEQVQMLYKEQFEKNEATIKAKIKLSETQQKRNKIIEKIKSGVPIIQIKFSDEISDMESKENTFVTDAINFKEVDSIIKIVKIKDIMFKMILVKGDTYVMGATLLQGGENKDEQVTHNVTLGDFYICTTQVTQELWNAIIGNNPSKIKDKNLPVTNVSWNDCQDFIKRLNDITGMKFRLPTEAEWEFAARGGQTGKLNGYKYSGSNTITNIMWYSKNSGNRPHEVSSKQSNELGLFDMSGNVWEWCSDWYASYDTSLSFNPKGPINGIEKVCRGGSFMSEAKECRVSIREKDLPNEISEDVGFRIVLSI